jgi:chromosome segregation ATPase
MLGSKKTSKAKTSDCVNTPEIQSLPPLAKPPTSEADDLAAQLSWMDSRYRTTLRTCQEAKQLGEAADRRLDTLEIQMQEMAEAINSISNAINDLTTKISSAPSKDASASQTPKPDIDSGSPK